MGISELMSFMTDMNRKFQYESVNIDPVHPDLDVDITFLELYLKAYKLYRNIVLIPHDTKCYVYYYDKFNQVLKTLREYVDKKDNV